jgi:hypothetical protein|tara:strand:+ start:2371 stop:2739 length:369 start_codon:yes stop_codon:yes gene_type:complete
MTERNHGAGPNKIHTSLKEQSPEYANKAPRPWDNVQIRMEYGEYGGQLWVDMDDERFTWGQGVLLEIWEGELRVVVWADPESEDPTHTIPISQMSYEFRKEYERDFEDGRQTNPAKPGVAGV